MFNSFASGGQTNRDLFANGANGNSSLLAGSCIVLSGVLDRCFVANDLRHVKQPQGPQCPTWTSHWSRSCWKWIRCARVSVLLRASRVIGIWFPSSAGVTETAPRTLHKSGTGATPSRDRAILLRALSEPVTNSVTVICTWQPVFPRRKVAAGQQQERGPHIQTSPPLRQVC